MCASLARMEIRLRRSITSKLLKSETALLPLLLSPLHLQIQRMPTCSGVEVQAREIGQHSSITLIALIAQLQAVK